MAELTGRALIASRCAKFFKNGDFVNPLFVKLDVSKTLYFCCYTSSCFD